MQERSKKALKREVGLRGITLLFVLLGLAITGVLLASTVYIMAKPFEHTKYFLYQSPTNTPTNPINQYSNTSWYN